MHPLETLIAFLFASDIIWGTLAALYVAIALPIWVIILKKREKNKK